MIRNYLLIALRSIRKQSVNALINLAGLAMGMACSLVIMLYVYAEWSYDRHFSAADRIYRIGISFFNIGNFALGPEALGEFLPKEYAGVEAFTRVYRDPEVPVRIGEEDTKVLVYYTDSAFFRVFDYEFVSGSAAKSLGQPKSMVMTVGMARQLFHEDNPVGKTVLAGKEKVPFMVTGIVRDDPRSSTLKAKVWMSDEQMLQHDFTWTSVGCYNFVKVREHSGMSELVAAMDRLLEKQVFANPAGVPPGLTFQQYKDHPNSVKFFVHPLTDIHLRSNLNYELSPTGNEANLMIFAGIAALILVLAAINFINLTTAQGAHRAREIGVRKTMGAARLTLFFQFILESIILCFLALPLSLLLCEAFIWLFKAVTGEQLLNALWLNPWGVVGLLIFVVVVGFLAGVYPAIILTSFRPAQVLKGAGGAIQSSRLRDVLVAFQLAISVGLTIVTFTVIRQMDYMKVKDLGFNQDQVITIDRVDKLGPKVAALKKEIDNLAGVKLTSLHSGEPGNKSVMSLQTFKSPNLETEMTLNVYEGDPDFIPLMGFQVIKGRGFNRELISDSIGVVLNESAVTALRLDDPIGAVVNDGQKIIGVVRDFHWETLRNQIAPMAIELKKNYYQLSVKLSGGSRDLIPQLEEKWKAVSDEPFTYHFLDENFEAILEKEKLLESSIAFFSVLATIISCLGLYGLSALTTLQRTKEIGIRKTLGASLADILLLLNRKLAGLLLVAVVVGGPAAWYFVNSWLSGFAYHIHPGVSMLAAAVLLSTLMAWLAVSYQSFRATRVNPAESLKYE